MPSIIPLKRYSQIVRFGLEPMKCSSPRILFMALLSHLTLATAQEFGRNGNLLLRETWTGPVSGSVTYTFGNDLDVTSRRVNARTAVAFSYDADRFLTGVGDLTITRHPQNALVTGTAISAVTDLWAYNEFAEPTNYSAAFGASPIYAVQFTRDAAGRIIAKTETIGGMTSDYTYAYDAAGRLMVVTLNGSSSAAYDYDSNGNRLSVVSGGTTRNSAYDEQD